MASPENPAVERWVFRGADSTTPFQLGVQGTIVGSAADTQGRVFAEVDGTGSVTGWASLTGRVTANETAITGINANNWANDTRIGNRTLPTVATAGIVKPTTAAFTSTLAVLFTRIGNWINWLLNRFDATTGHIHDGTTDNAPRVSIIGSQLPVFTATDNGAVPVPPNGTPSNALLNADGTWKTPEQVTVVVDDTVIGTRILPAVTNTTIAKPATAAFTANLTNLFTRIGNWINWLLNRFNATTGHTHDGTTDNAPRVSIIASQLPAFTTNDNGVVTAPGSSIPSDAVLRANGTWSQVSVPTIPPLMLKSYKDATTGLTNTLVIELTTPVSALTNITVYSYNGGATISGAVTLISGSRYRWTPTSGTLPDEDSFGVAVV
jgi:hypothetical protein